MDVFLEPTKVDLPMIEPKSSFPVFIVKDLIAVIMSRNRNLTDLKNIGKTIAGRLNEVGIFTEADLNLAGAVGAHRLIKEKHPNETESPTVL